MTPHRFHPAALAEYEAAALWYGPDGGLRFVEAVERAIDELCLLPLAWPRLTVDARVLGTFPYSIIYEPEAASILVIAVAHHHRRPGYWRSRAVDPR